MRKTLLVALALLPAGLVGASAQQMTPPWQQSATGCAFNTVPPTLTSGWLGFLQCDSAGRLIVSSSGGGTSSSFGAAFPATGTAAGFSNGTNMVAGRATGAAIADDTTPPTASILLTNTYPMAFDGTNWDRLRTVPGAAATGVGVLATNPIPTSSSLSATTSASSTAAASNLVLKASAGNLYSLTVTIGATSGYLMLFDATSLPSNGAVTPVYCLPVTSNGTNGFAAVEFSTPKRFGTGITAGFSTTGCFTLTASATGNFFGGYQ